MRQPPLRPTAVPAPSSRCQGGRWSHRSGARGRSGLEIRELRAQGLSPAGQASSVRVWCSGAPSPDNMLAWDIRQFRVLRPARTPGRPTAWSTEARQEGGGHRSRGGGTGHDGPGLSNGAGRWGGSVLLLEAAKGTAPRRAQPTRGQLQGDTSAAELRGVQGSHRDTRARVLPEPPQRLLRARPSQALGAVSNTNTNGLLSDPSETPTQRSSYSNSG